MRLVKSELPNGYVTVKLTAAGHTEDVTAILSVIPYDPVLLEEELASKAQQWEVNL